MNRGGGMGHSDTETEDRPSSVRGDSQSGPPIGHPALLVDLGMASTRPTR